MGAFNSQISSDDSEVKTQTQVTKKLLFLGTGSSGKSTLFKQLQRIYGSGFDENEITETAINIQSNCINGILQLLKQSQNLYDENPNENSDCNVPLDEEDIGNDIRVLMSLKDVILGEEGDEQELSSLEDAIESLWALESVKSTYKKRGGRFSFPENMEFFFNKVKSLMKPSYQPTNEDILLARTRTSGVLEADYTLNKNRFKIFDVGGQRMERKKWIHAFEQVSAVLFVTALNDYNRVLFEDEQKNSMHESLALFTEICNSKWFRNTEIILLLNKNDLFELELKKGNMLSIFFNKGGKFNHGGPMFYSESNITEYNPKVYNINDFEICYKQSLKFIENVFKSKIKNKNRFIHTIVVSAIDENNVKTVFEEIQKIVIMSKLKGPSLIVNKNLPQIMEESKVYENSETEIDITTPLINSLDLSVSNETKENKIDDEYYSLLSNGIEEYNIYGAKQLLKYSDNNIDIVKQVYGLSKPSSLSKNSFTKSGSTIKLTLNLPYIKWNKYEKNFVEDLAFILEINEYDIKILNVTEGSTVLDIWLKYEIIKFQKRYLTKIVSNWYNKVLNNDWNPKHEFMVDNIFKYYNVNDFLDIISNLKYLNKNKIDSDKSQIFNLDHKKDGKFDIIDSIETCIIWYTSEQKYLNYQNEMKQFEQERKENKIVFTTNKYETYYNILMNDNNYKIKLFIDSNLSWYNNSTKLDEINDYHFKQMLENIRDKMKLYLEVFVYCQYNNIIFMRWQEYKQNVTVVKTLDEVNNYLSKYFVIDNDILDWLKPLTNYNYNKISQHSLVLGPNNSSNDMKEIKCPYIIMISISDYTEWDSTGKTNLPSTKNDIEIMKQLFTNIYNYKYVKKIAIDSIMDEDDLIDFLEKAVKNMEYLHKSTMNETPDSVIFFYAGHAEKYGIILPDGSKYSYSEIRSYFDNKHMEWLINHPKLYFYDCCQGKNHGKSINLSNNSNNNSKINTIKRNKIQVKKKIKNKSFNVFGRHLSVKSNIFLNL